MSMPATYPRPNDRLRVVRCAYSGFRSVDVSSPASQSNLNCRANLDCFLSFTLGPRAVSICLPRYCARISAFSASCRASAAVSRRCPYPLSGPPRADDAPDGRADDDVRADAADAADDPDDDDDPLG